MDINSLSLLLCELGLVIPPSAASRQVKPTGQQTHPGRSLLGRCCRNLLPDQWAAGPWGSAPSRGWEGLRAGLSGGWGCGGRGWKGRLRSGPQSGWMVWPFPTIGAIGVGEDGAASTGGLTSIRSHLPDAFPALWVATVGSMW